MIFYSLDIDFIHGDIHDQSCKKCPIMAEVYSIESCFIIGARQIYRHGIVQLSLSYIVDYSNGWNNVFCIFWTDTLVGIKLIYAC